MYALLYFNVDDHNCNEIYGIYNTKEESVKKLIEIAGYRDKNGKLTQYMEETDEYYGTYSFLYSKVYNDMKLLDIDLYKIIELD